MHCYLNSVLLGDCDWKAGSLSGCVYNADDDVTKLVTEVYGMSAWSNPLHPEVFPGIRFVREWAVLLMKSAHLTFILGRWKLK